MKPILSLFPGIDLLGRGFEQAGFCVVRGPDILYGGDIRHFHPPPGVFEGIIGGPPCQDFSRARWKKSNPPTGQGLEMLEQYRRCVEAAQPTWWLMENVDTVPDLHIPGYTWQRLDVRATEFGLSQSRLRHIQFGAKPEWGTLILERPNAPPKATQPCALATEGTRTTRRSWPDFCQLQGLPPDFDLPGLTLSAKYAAVGNGVPIPVALALAQAIHKRAIGTPCGCGCGRPLPPGRTYAKGACRQRMHRRRVTELHSPTPAT